MANARAAAKIKWNTTAGKAWRAEYNKSSKGVAARPRYWVSSLAQRTLVRWREATARMRATEARCRARFKANLAAAEAALTAGADVADLPEAQRRALTTPTGERGIRRRVPSVRPTTHPGRRPRMPESLRRT